MRQRARDVWHVALGASWIALLGLPVGALAADTPVGIIADGLGVVALLVMLVAALLALWLRLYAYRRIDRNFVAFYCLLAVLACFRPAFHRPPLRPVATAVYDAVIDSVYSRGRPDTVLIADSSLVFRAPATDAVPRWRVQFDSIPPGLVAELVHRSATRLPSSHLALPNTARTITRTELREIFSSGPRGWDEFYRRYPRQRLWIALSPVVFSQDSTQALLYREYHCGGLCGRGDLMWLERRADSKWHVRKRLTYWIS
jgi:hypothetical protein